jgi:hypothetical protein
MTENAIVGKWTLETPRCPASASLDVLSILAGLTWPVQIGWSLAWWSCSHAALGRRCFCQRRLKPSDADHALTCTAHCGACTMPGATIVRMLRRTAHHADIASAVKPTLWQLLCVMQATRRPACHGSAERQVDKTRADALFAVPDGILVMHVSVMHPSAASFVMAMVCATDNAATPREHHCSVRHSR